MSGPPHCVTALTFVPVGGDGRLGECTKNTAGSVIGQEKSQDIV
jgi:hypothetical protein